MGLGLLGGPGDLVIKYVVSSRVVSNILNRFPKWSYPNYSITCNRLTKSPGPPSRLWGLFAVYIYIYVGICTYIIYIWVNIYIYIYIYTHVHIGIIQSGIIVLVRGLFSGSSTSSAKIPHRGAPLQLSKDLIVLL